MHIVDSGSGDGDYDAALWMELWAGRCAIRSSRPRARSSTGAGGARSPGSSARDSRAGEFGPADADEFAVLLAALLDGLAVQIALTSDIGGATPELACGSWPVKLAERELAAC